MTAPLPTFAVGAPDDDLAVLRFLRLHAERDHRHVVRLSLKGGCTIAVLPERAREVRTVQHESALFAVAEVDDAVVLLEGWPSAGGVHVSADDVDAARSIAEEVRDRVPRPQPEGKVDVAFTDQQAGTRFVSLQARPWQTVRDNYPQAVRDALDSLVTHTPEPENASRLLLWHGLPGGGKTTAIRALLDAWRGWADGVVVADPDALLTDGRYLRRTVLEHDDSERWQLLVLEDAETLLHKGGAGRGMATLLNLCDGLLGQGLRCLFLITTNEPLDSVHPALTRAGRCLSKVEFGRLPAAQAASILGRPVSRPMTLAEVFNAPPVTTTATEPVAIGQYL